MFGWNASEWYTLSVNVAFKSALVLGAAWVAALLLRNASAAARHLAWTTAFAALLALPFLSLSLPVLRVPVAPDLVPPGLSFQITGSPGHAEAAVSQLLDKSIAPADTRRRSDWRWLPALAWLAGAALSFAHMLFGWIAVQRIRRSARPFPVRDAAFGIDTGVAVLETAPGSMPATCGLLSPVIFMPADAAEWNEERRRFVLLHELAHVRRGDTATHLLARTALSLYWWNPLAWIAWSELLKERERAADDLVLRAGARASDYAGHLLEIARSMQSPVGFAAAAIPVARPSQLEGRLLAILDSGRNRASSSRVSAIAGAVLAATLVLPIAAFQAQLAPAQTPPADVEATIRTAVGGRNPQTLEQAAKAAETLRKYDIARRLFESSLSMRALISGRQSAEYAMGLLTIGDLERKRGRLGDAVPFYTEALSILGDRTETGPALIALGIQAIRQKDTGGATGYFERARVASPGNAGTALMWMAVARERESNFAAAEALYQQALVVSAPDSTEAATAMEMYANFLHWQGSESQSAALKQQSAELRKSLLAEATSKSSGPVSEVYRVGAGVTPPVVLSKVEPGFSEEALVAKYEGTVVVYAEIGVDGKAGNISLRRGLGLGLDEKAIEAITQWSFQPGVRNGQPVVVAASIEVNFRLR